MPDTIIAGMVAGLFALLGAFFGAALTRRTEYEKWLRQARTESFATFLRELHDTRLLATTTYYDQPGTEQEKSMRVTEAFVRFGKHVAHARLFMSEEGRAAVSSLVNELWVHCTAHGGPGSRPNQLKQIMEGLQAVVERELNRTPGNFRWSVVRVRNH